MEKGLTLNELSKETGLSTGYLSQFERGITTIAVDSLQKIADVLETNISEFFKKLSTNEAVISKSFEHKPTNMIGEYYIEESLSQSTEVNQFYARIITILPKLEDQDILEYTHDGEEFIYVLEGILTFYYKGEKNYLYPGDSAHYSSKEMHNWSNETSKNTKIICVSYPLPDMLR